MLSLVTASPEFFTQRKTPAAAIVLFAVAIIFVVPAFLLLAEALADRAGPGWGHRLHGGVRVVLLAALALQLLNALDLGATSLVGVGAPTWTLFLGAFIVALGAVYLLGRSPAHGCSCGSSPWPRPGRCCCS